MGELTCVKKMVKEDFMLSCDHGLWPLHCDITHKTFLCLMHASLKVIECHTWFPLRIKMTRIDQMVYI